MIDVPGHQSKPVPAALPLAITMWDFSWLERRWPGAGYDDWDRALDELCERGYNAVRIDAFPHLVDALPDAEHELLPLWSVHSWGAPMSCTVRVLPALTEFIAACAARQIKVGLSAWYRRDTRELWRLLCTPRRHAESWIHTIAAIEAAGLLDAVLYVDLCNEWPLRVWAPFLYGTDVDSAAVAGGDQMPWFSDRALAWLREAIRLVRGAYPDLPLTVSVHPWDGPFETLGFLDFFEPHIWMSGGEFYQRVGYTFKHRFDNGEYENVRRNARRVYESDKPHWHAILRERMDQAIGASRALGKPLMTTECWGITDYKDGPGLDWGWVKEVCAAGVEYAVASGRWIATATSNFAGPQFAGMWRDIEWHQRQTRIIRNARIATPVPEHLLRRVGGRTQAY